MILQRIVVHANGFFISCCVACPSSSRDRLDYRDMALVIMVADCAPQHLIAHARYPRHQRRARSALDGTLNVGFGRRLRLTRFTCAFTIRVNVWMVHCSAGCGVVVNVHA